MQMNRNTWWKTRGSFQRAVMCPGLRAIQKLTGYEGLHSWVTSGWPTMRPVTVVSNVYIQEPYSGTNVCTRDCHATWCGKGASFSETSPASTHLWLYLIHRHHSHRHVLINVAVKHPSPNFVRNHIGRHELRR